MLNSPDLSAALTSANDSGRPGGPGLWVGSTLELGPTQWTWARKMAGHSCIVDGHALGWLPYAAIDGAHAQGRMIAAIRNADEIGYMIWGLSRGEIRIFYTWVRADARLIEHGRALTTWVARKGAQHGAIRIGLWCAEDLAANLFWASLGFRQVSWRWGKGSNPRRILQWWYDLSPVQLLQSPA